MAKADLTPHRLRELLNYDPETGVLTWASDIMGGHGHRQVIKRAGTPAGTSRSRAGYRVVGVAGAVHYAHRLVFLYMTGEWPCGEVDHIDGDKENLRWSNLRDVSPTVNKQNIRGARSNSASGRLGIYLHRTSGLWHASIMADGKRSSLGYFKTADEAHDAHIRAKRKLHEGCTI